MSTALNQFTDMIIGHEQQARAIEARAKLQNMVWTLQEGNAQITSLKDAGALDKLPTELKQGLNKIWTELRNCQAAIEALDEKDLLENS